MYKAVIFDFDGTLVDTLPDLCSSINATLKENGFPIQYDLEGTKKLIGSGIRNLCIRSVKQYTNEEKVIDKLYDDFGKNYKIRQIDQTKPFPGIENLLTYLKSNGIKIVILSNKTDDNTLFISQHVFKENYFDYILGKRPELPLKPDPTSLNLVIDKLNITKEEVLYVGDSDTDMETAINGNVKKVAVTWGYRDISVLKEYNPDYIVSTPKEIENIIKNDRKK